MDAEVFPRISIVVPSYNQSQFLGSTLDSLLSQNYPNLQLIVIDGGSSDTTPEILQRYAPQLDYWVSEPDEGHGDALNKGFALADGEILTWLNSDDVMLPGALGLVGDLLTRFPEIDWLTGVPTRMDADDRLVRIAVSRKNLLDFVSGNYRWVQQEGTFWRRGLWERAGGRIDTSYDFMIDGELWSRFFPLAELYHLQAPLAAFRAWGENRSAKNAESCESEMKRCTAHLRASLGPLARLAAGVNGLSSILPQERHPLLDMPRYLTAMAASAILGGRGGYLRVGHRMANMDWKIDRVHFPY